MAPHCVWLLSLQFSMNIIKGSSSDSISLEYYLSSYPFRFPKSAISIYSSGNIIVHHEEHSILSQWYDDFNKFSFAITHTIHAIPHATV